MTSQLKHPSNRLYNGECTDVVDALETYIGALRFEEATCARLARDFGATDGPDGVVAFPKELMAAQSCLSQYTERVHSIAQTLFAEWAASDDPNVKMIGEAAQSSDFSILAI